MKIILNKQTNKKISLIAILLASFYRHVSVTPDKATAMLGGVELQMIRGDIISAGTDVIVNTTDFSNYQTGKI